MTDIKYYHFKNTTPLSVRPVPNSHGRSNNCKSFWVEVEATKNNYEWIGNLHKLKNGMVEACPKDFPCATFDNLYLAMDYIREKTGTR